MGSSSIEAEFNEIDQGSWSSAYQNIKELSEREARELNFSVDESSKADNRRLNRYRDVNPYDHSRIVLKRGKTDYINANLVKMEKANRSYILTQGPLPHTLSHFWLMIWEQNTKAILMLNKLIEKKQIKCHMYWPEEVGPENKMVMDDVGLELEMVCADIFTNYTRRTFHLHDNQSQTFREVIQFHYNTWPDFGIPSSPLAFLQFLKQVRDSGALSADVGPAVVHCSAGIGRSGTFCLVDSCLVLVDKDNQNKVSVKELLLELRRYRLGLIQTFDQLYFSYKAIIEGIRLFKDPSFLEYNEVPQHATDEGPPLPPPRGESLDLFNKKTHDLSPPPTKKLPPIIDEPSNSDDDDVSSSEIEEESNSDNETGDEDPSDVSREEMNIVDELNALKRNVLHEASSAVLAAHTNGHDESFDADGTLPPPPPAEKMQTNGFTSNIGNNNESSPGDGTEVRRRKRQERVSTMEDKIRDIKRKQRDAEEAPKKRRLAQKSKK